MNTKHFDIIYNYIKYIVCLELMSTNKKVRQRFIIRYLKTLICRNMFNIHNVSAAATCGICEVVSVLHNHVGSEGYILIVTRCTHFIKLTSAAATAIGTPQSIMVTAYKNIVEVTSRQLCLPESGDTMSHALCSTYNDQNLHIWFHKP